jgi:hypothetical protein
LVYMCRGVVERLCRRDCGGGDGLMEGQLARGSR